METKVHLKNLRAFQYCLFVMLSCYCLLLGCRGHDSTDFEVRDGVRVYSKDLGAIILCQSELSTWKKTHVFKLTNTTSEPWELDISHVSCGCATATIQDRSLPPGHSTTVEMSVEPRYECERRTERVVLSTGGTSSQSLVFNLTMMVYPRVSLDSGGTRIERCFFENEKPEIKFDVICFGTNEELNQHLGRELTWEASQELSLDAGSTATEHIGDITMLRFPFTATLKHDKSGRIDCPVNLRFLNVETEVEVTFEKKPAVVVSPQSAFFSERNRSNRIVLESDDPVKVKKILCEESKFDVVQVSGELKPTFIVTWKNGADSFSKNDSITFLIDHPDQRMVELNVCNLGF